MALFLWACLLGSANAFLATTSSFTVSTQLKNLTDPLKVVFFDFDRTLVVGSVGDRFQTLWCPACATYEPTPGPCACDATTTSFAELLEANASSLVLAEGGLIFNGTDRRDRIVQTLELLRSKGIEIAIVSTSRYSLRAVSWANFISKVLEIANLTQYINVSQVLTLDDPGLDIPADKAGLMVDYLARQGWNLHEALFVDDSSSNIAQAAGKVDYLFVLPRDGVSVDQLEWIEARANPVNCSSLSPPSFATVGSCNSAVRTGETCSITCADGYSISGGASQTCKATTTTFSAFTGTQYCTVATCAALVVANGTAGTCTGHNTSHEEFYNTNCSITCNEGFTVNGTAAQNCLGTGPGASAYPNTQNCVAATCAAPVVANGTAGTCTGQTTNETCSITCNEGFNLNGAASQTCMATGPGASAYPNTQSCVVVTCAPLSAPAHGSVSTCNATRPLGENCSLACDDGYSLFTAGPIACVLTSPTTAAYVNDRTCEAATCAAPVVVNGTAGTCTGQTTNENCSITCNAGFKVNGNTSQACLPTGPGASAYPNTQSCVALGNACPASSIALFLNTCTDGHFARGCSAACATASNMMSKEFAELKETAQFIGACFRNQSSSILNTANTDRVISLLQNGGTICTVNSAQAFDALFPLVFTLAMVFLA